MAQPAGLVHEGERAIVTASVPVGASGATNMTKAHHIGNVLVTDMPGPAWPRIIAASPRGILRDAIIN